MPIHRLGQILVFCILTDGKRKNNIPIRMSMETEFDAQVPFIKTHGNILKLRNIATIP